MVRVRVHRYSVGSNSTSASIGYGLMFSKHNFVLDLRDKIQQCHINIVGVAYSRITSVTDSVRTPGAVFY